MTWPTSSEVTMPAMAPFASGHPETFRTLMNTMMMTPLTMSRFGLLSKPVLQTCLHPALLLPHPGSPQLSLPQLSLSHPSLTHPSLTHPSLTHPSQTRPSLLRPSLLRRSLLRPSLLRLKMAVTPQPPSKRKRKKRKITSLAPFRCARHSWAGAAPSSRPWHCASRQVRPDRPQPCLCFRCAPLRRVSRTPCRPPVSRRCRKNPPRPHLRQPRHCQPKPQPHQPQPHLS